MSRKSPTDAATKSSYQEPRIKETDPLTGGKDAKIHPDYSGDTPTQASAPGADESRWDACKLASAPVNSNDSSQKSEDKAEESNRYPESTIAYLTRCKQNPIPVEELEDKLDDDSNLRCVVSFEVPRVPIRIDSKVYDLYRLDPKVKAWFDDSLVEISFNDWLPRIENMEEDSGLWTFNADGQRCNRSQIFPATNIREQLLNYEPKAEVDTSGVVQFNVSDVPSESRHLLSNKNRPTHFSVKPYCGVALLASVIATAVVLSKRSSGGTHAASVHLSYSAQAPYSPGITVNIWNSGNASVTVESVTFTSNIEIDAASNKNYYGDLAPYNKCGLYLINQQGNQYTYQLSINQEDAYVVIAPGKSSSATFVYHDTKSVLPIMTLPTDIKVTTTQGHLTDVPVADKCVAEACDNPAPGEVAAAYYESWGMYQREYPASHIPTHKINRINYFTMGVDSSGAISSLDPNADNIQLPAIQQLQLQYPYLEVFLSFGEANSVATIFSELIKSNAAVENFANNAVAALQQFNFNGVSIDCEPLTAINVEQFTAFIKTVSQKLKSTNPAYQLTLTIPAGADNIQQLKALLIAVEPYVDGFELMAYDFAGPWSEQASYQDAWQLPSSDLEPSNAIAPTLAALDAVGVAHAKTLIGAPSYFRATTVADTAHNKGYGSLVVRGGALGQFDNTTGVWDAGCVLANTCTGATNALPSDLTCYNGNDAPFGNLTQATWCASKQAKIVLSGPSVKGITKLGCYMQGENYQGGFIFSADQDATSDQSMVAAMHKGLTSNQCQAESSQVNKQFFAERAIPETSALLPSAFVSGMASGFTAELLDKGVDATFAETKVHAAIPAALKASLQAMIYYYVGTPLLPYMVGKLLLTYYRQTNTAEPVAQTLSLLGSLIITFGQNPTLLGLDNLPELASNLSLGMSGSVVGALAAKAMSTVCGYFGSFFAAGPKSSADDAADRMERGFSC